MKAVTQSIVTNWSPSIGWSLILVFTQLLNFGGQFWVTPIINLVQVTSIAEHFSTRKNCLRVLYLQNYDIVKTLIHNFVFVSFFFNILFNFTQYEGRWA